MNFRSGVIAEALRVRGSEDLLTAGYRTKLLWFTSNEPDACAQYRLPSAPSGLSPSLSLLLFATGLDKSVHFGNTGEHPNLFLRVLKRYPKQACRPVGVNTALLYLSTERVGWGGKIGTRLQQQWLMTQLV